MMLDVAYVRSILDYNQDTGIFRWKVQPTLSVKVGRIAGTYNHYRGDINIQIKSKLYKAHRLAWFYINGVWPEKFIDHRDGDSTNNRINNLREATNAQNLHNRGAQQNNKLGVKGVTRTKRGLPYSARIRANGKDVCLGSFKTIEEASSVYRAAAIRLHGEFAKV